MTHEEIRQRAINSENVLNNPSFITVWDELKDVWTTKWENSEETDTKTREVCYNRLKAIQEVKREFVKHLNAQRIIERG